MFGVSDFFLWIPWKVFHVSFFILEMGFGYNVLMMLGLCCDQLWLLLFLGFDSSIYYQHL